jgi:hypothetical protein
LIEALRRVAEPFGRRTNQIELQGVHQFFAYFG